MQLFPDHVLEVAAAVLDQLKHAGRRVATAESCTGGLIAAALTEIAGSSDAIGRGFVTYSNDAKREVLGVPADMLIEHGAVSEATVRRMAEGALAACGTDADYAVAVSGVAGPGGGSPEKPVGTVWMAVAARGMSTAAERRLFPGDRTEIRVRTVESALRLLQRHL